MNVRPRRNYLIIEMVEDQNISAGGIIKPKRDKKQACIGRVLQVGPGSYDDEGKYHTCGVEVGDLIAYDINMRKTFNVEGEDVVFLMSEGVFGKLPA